MQDDHENVRRRSRLRPDANSHGQRGRSHRVPDSGVPQGQSGNRFYRAKQSRSVPVHPAISGGAGIRVQGQEAARSGAGVPRQNYRLERATDDATHSPVPARRRRRGRGVPPAAVSDQVHQPGCGAAGGSRPGARLAERAGDGAHPRTGVRAVRQGRVCAPGGAFGVAPVQPEGERALPQAGGAVEADATERHTDRGAAQTRSARTSGLCAGRHRAPGRLGRSEGGLSHQRGRCGDAVAGGGVCGTDHRAAYVTSAGSDAASVSISDPGLSLRQRQRVCEPRRCGNAERVADRVHQEPCQPDAGQRAGGRQERSDHSQAHWLRAHRSRACGGSSEVPHGVLKPIPELSPSVRVRDGEFGCEGQAAPAIQAGRLCDAVREAERAGESGAVLEGEHELRLTGTDGGQDERHGMCAEVGDGRSSRCFAGARWNRRGRADRGGAQGRKRAVEMPGPWREWKSKSSFSTPSTVPWKSRRGREIPTFPPPGFADLEKWKTRSRFPTFPRPLATTAIHSLSNRKPKERKSAAMLPPLI